MSGTQSSEILEFSHKYCKSSFFSLYRTRNYQKLLKYKTGQFKNQILTS